MTDNDDVSGKPSVEVVPLRAAPIESSDWEKTWPKAKKDLKTLIISTDKFIVFLHRKMYVDWLTSPDFDRELEEKGPKVGGVLGEIAKLEAIPNEHQPEATRHAFLCMLGEALARAFDGQEASAKSILKTAHEFITLRNQEIARVWYLEGCASVALIAAVCTLAVWTWRLEIAAAWTRTGVHLLLGAGAGAAGAFLSVLLRLGNPPLDPGAGRRLHRIEGGARCIAGALGGFLIAIGTKLGLLFPAMSAESEVLTLILASFVAGASERRVATFIKKTESHT